MTEPVKVELMCFVVLQESIRTVFHFVLKILQQKSKFVERNRFRLPSPESFSCFSETWMKIICCCSVTKVVLLQNLSAADFSFYKFYIQINFGLKVFLFLFSNYLTSLHFWWILYFFKDFREIQIKQTADWPVSHVISSYSCSLWGWLLLIKTIEWTDWWHYSVNSVTENVSVWV